MKSTTFAVVAACLLAVAAAEIYIVADNEQIRMINNETAAVMTAPTDVISADTDNGGLLSLVLNEETQKFYGVHKAEHVVYEVDASVSPWKVSVFAGQKTTTGKADGVGTVAEFNAPSSVALDASGNLYVADSGAHHVRKITPDQTVTSLAGLADTAGADDGEGTNAKFTGPLALKTLPNGDLLAIETTGAIRQITPAGAVSTVQASTTGTADGVGTNAQFQQTLAMAVSADGKTVYTMTAGDDALPTVSTASDIIRKVDLESKTVTTIAGALTQTTASVDGDGTNAIFSNVASIALTGAGDLIVGEACADGGVIRKVTPPGAGETVGTSALIAGDYTANSCVGNTPSASANWRTYTDGTGTSAVIQYPASILPVEKVCGKFFNIGSDTTVEDECDDIGSGRVKELTAKAKLTITSILVVIGKLRVQQGGVINANAPVTVNDALEFTGNGTLICNDNDVNVNSVAFTDDSVYQVLISRAVPGIIKSRGAAAIKGTIVVVIASTYDFVVGATANVLEFASFDGTFAKVYLIKNRGVRSARSLLQSSAPSANVACSSTSCQATGVATSADDDDEVPFIVALIVVGALLLAGLIAAVYFASTGGMKKSSSSSKPAAAATAYGGDAAAVEADDYSSSSSSSVMYDAFGPAEYSYSY